MMIQPWDSWSAVSSVVVSMRDASAGWRAEYALQGIATDAHEANVFCVECDADTSVRELGDRTEVAA